MIHEILDSEKCAACKGCCKFAKGEEWEIPSCVTATPTADSRLLVCDELTENGCRLQEKKPAECAMYPFRVMRLGDYTVIALSRYCKAVAELPLSRIMSFAEDNCEKFLSVSKEESIKEYNSEYVILKVIKP